MPCANGSAVPHLRILRYHPQNHTIARWCPKVRLKFSLLCVLRNLYRHDICHIVDGENNERMENQKSVMDRAFDNVYNADL